jgi:hypothetical protein
VGPAPCLWAEICRVWRQRLFLFLFAFLHDVPCPAADMGGIPTGPRGGGDHKVQLRLDKVIRSIRPREARQSEAGRGKVRGRCQGHELSRSAYHTKGARPRACSVSRSLLLYI